MKNVFITGASGFLGRNLALKLLNKGYNITALSRKNVNIGGINFIKGDINNYDDVLKAMKNCSIVFHLAALTPYDLINGNRELAFNTYLQGSLNVLNAFRNSNANTFIYSSSGKVYGNKNKVPFKESMITIPTVYMGQLKKQVENLIKLFSNNVVPDKRMVVLRIFNAYGPYQSNYFLIPKLINSTNNGNIIIGNDSIQRDYIYVSDIIDAFLIVMNIDSNGFFCYNVGSGVSVSIKEISDIIEKITSKKPKIILDEKKIRSDERLIEFASIEKISKIGWHPKISLENGIKAICDLQGVKEG